MQLGLLGMLLGLPQGALLGEQGQGKAQGGMADLFAQLLGDSAQQEAGQQSLGGGGQLLADIAPSTLVAQEVTDTAATGTSELEALQDLLNKEISAEDAADLLTQWDALSTELGKADADAQELLAQLKNELGQIRDSKEPKSVGAVLTQLSALQAAPAERAPVVERMLAWMKDALNARQKAIAQRGDAATEQAAAASDTAPSALLQSLQAASFRDGDTAETATPEEEGKGRDYIEIVPLSLTAQTTAPAWVQRLTDNAAQAATQTAAAPEAIAPEHGYEIPGLELTADAESTTVDKEALPDINLPHLKPEAKHAAAAFRAALEAAPHTTETTASADEQATAQVAGLQAHGTHATSNDARSTPVHVTSHVATNHAPVAEQVHVAVQRATKEGIDQLTIQLEPADLGRVEVKMSTGADGQTQLSFVVDKAETMDALARDARSLERALQDAGVKADAGNMQFNLRQQAQPDTGQGQQGGQQRYGNGDDDDASIAPQAAAASTQHYQITLKDGVDIRA